ncbi:MAG: hypothetical protein DHS80DRAFT_29014 [Piptocephalis tieghemiana]|nr:MAG: hypothetical protein DHS80DRAFT_29014 [Piptocephalis tieghemiana]
MSSDLPLPFFAVHDRRWAVTLLCVVLSLASLGMGQDVVSTPSSSPPTSDPSASPTSDPSATSGSSTTSSSPFQKLTSSWSSVAWISIAVGLAVLVSIAVGFWVWNRRRRQQLEKERWSRSSMHACPYPGPAAPPYSGPPPTPGTWMLPGHDVVSSPYQAHTLPPPGLEHSKEASMRDHPPLTQSKEDAPQGSFLTYQTTPPPQYTMKDASSSSPSSSPSSPSSSSSSSPTPPHRTSSLFIR